ncbi:hypothetical protein HPB51_011540 [Rhipicephalus microplus]|uniref:Carboxylesterase type B domain-containing protein n=1 Tax=Rhipicephalus microplus TaxID=6941 RepID=A0A9J6E8Y6_RHIMP|nr:hypothetical protein HPB51_011540 [Rhipicephalus microplus]
MGGTAASMLMLFTVIPCCFASDVLKKTRLGWIKGNQLQVLGRTVDEFRGIPYAHPPLNALRFRPPRPYGPWNGTLDARSKRTACPQVVPNPKAYTGITLTEDCLQLNIWSPQTRTKDVVPVLVWIHGGGFTSGSSALDWYNGVVLAARTGLVVASFNYRLNLLGFLDAQTPQAPGNVGFLDQNLALQWIRANIDQYGGDASRVTIFGDSAGGMSVHGHLISPLSSGLFTRGNQSVYTYVFGHQSKKNPLPSWMGIPHSYDVNYMFGRPLVDQHNFTAEDARVSELEIKALSTFAFTGEPMLPGDHPWPKYTSDNTVSVYISGDNVTEIRDFHMEKCEVWRKFWNM